MSGKRYKPIDPKWIEELGLGLTLWEGEYLGISDNWLRWCDRDGKVLLTGQESAERKQQTIDNQERAIEKLREQLRAVGVDPVA